MAYLYPVFFGLFVPMSIYALNSGEILISETIAPYSLITAISLAVMRLARRTRQNSHRSAILLSLFWLLFFQFGRFNQLLWG